MMHGCATLREMLRRFEMAYVAFGELRDLAQGNVIYVHPP